MGLEAETTRECTRVVIRANSFLKRVRPATLPAMSQSSAVYGLKAHENKAQGFSPVAMHGTGYAT